MNAARQSVSDIEMIRRALEMLGEAVSVDELRVPRSPHGTVSGYFSDLGAMVKSAASVSGKAEPGDAATGQSRSPKAWCAVTAQFDPVPNGRM